MRLNYRPLSEFIREIKERNLDGSITTLLGINIDKYFMPSVANVVGTDLTVYKVVKKGQFACNRMHVGRDKRLPVAVSKSVKDFIVSPAYDVFEIIDESVLNPEYLMMWFSRKEFDRNAWFYTDADIRGGLSWSAFCDMQIPVPSIEKQKRIIDEYNTIVNRIKINEQLNKKLEETAQAIYKQWFVDFEFPDKNGNPYKSSGGEMKYIAELDKEIPDTWDVGCLGDMIELQRGYDLPTQNRKVGKYPIYASTGIVEMHNEYKVRAPGIVTGRSGSLGEVFYIDEDFWPLNTTLWVKKFKKAKPSYTFFVLKGINISDYNSGSAVPTLNRNHIHRHQLIIPDINLINKFERIAKSLFNQIKIRNIKHTILVSFKDVLLLNILKSINGD